jgi:hypothetical protein
MTEEQRISIIRHAHQNSQKICPPKSIQEFIGDILVEQLVTEHGLLDTQKEDLADESQFLFTDSAENIDEEDEQFGISDEMKGIYHDS